MKIMRAALRHIQKRWGFQIALATGKYLDWVDDTLNAPDERTRLMSVPSPVEEPVDEPSFPVCEDCGGSGVPSIQDPETGEYISIMTFENVSCRGCGGRGWLDV